MLGLSSIAFCLVLLALMHDTNDTHTIDYREHYLVSLEVQARVFFEEEMLLKSLVK